MRRRSRAGSEQAKARSRGAQMPKRRKASTMRGRGSSATGERIKAVQRERDEALEQLFATSEVLKVISSSPGDLKPVFEAILEKATRICAAKFGILFTYDGGFFQYAAVRHAPEPLVRFLRRRGPFKPPSGAPLHQILKTRDVAHRADDSADQVPSASARWRSSFNRRVFSMAMTASQFIAGVTPLRKTEDQQQ
jgi:hypothetical protein